MGLLATLSHIWDHPIARRARVTSYADFIRWQLGSRLLPGAVSVPFVNDAVMMVERGMTGATGNLYCGLHDPADMGFLLHFLRPDELFVDVGANVGAYSILAGAVVGSDVLAVEPIPSTFQNLQRNLSANGLSTNGLSSRPGVEALNIGLADAAGELRFIADLDTVNQVATADTPVERTEVVRVERLDDVLGERVPTLVKMDVEGFETRVCAGAEKMLAEPGLRALIIEVSPALELHGSSPDALVSLLRAAGFTPVDYDCFNRHLTALPSWNAHGNNTLFVRDLDAAQGRLSDGPTFTVKGLTL